MTRTLRANGWAPEVWPQDEWASACLAGDWNRRKALVARDYVKAQRIVWAREFEAAWAQRILNERTPWPPPTSA
jgi:hypothetical protein